MLNEPTESRIDEYSRICTRAVPGFDLKVINDFYVF